MKTKTDKGIQRGGKRLLIDRISNYLSPLAAKLTLLQQLQNTTKIFCWCLMSCFSGLRIFHLFNTVSKLHPTPRKLGVAHIRAS